MLDPRHVTEHLEEVRAAIGRRSGAHGPVLEEALAQFLHEERVAVSVVLKLLKQGL